MNSRSFFRLAACALSFILLMNSNKGWCDPSRCVNLVVDFARKSPDLFDFETLRNDFANHRNPNQKSWNAAIEAQRFVVAGDWRAEESAGSSAPWNRYGIDMFGSWKAAAQFVQKNYKTITPSNKAIQRIHLIASEGMFYRGFERRRIDAAFDKGELKQSEYQELMSKLDSRQEVYFSGADHTSLGGRFRREPLDDDITGGMPFRTGGRDLTATELQNLRSIPGIDVYRVIELENGLKKVFIRYPKIAAIEPMVAAVFNKVVSALNSNSKISDKVATISQMQIELLAIHPFLNGNGRAIRLLADALYFKIGLPPPVHLSDNDFLLSGDDRILYAQAGMFMYVGQLP